MEFHQIPCRTLGQVGRGAPPARAPPRRDPVLGGSRRQVWAAVALGRRRKQSLLPLPPRGLLRGVRSSAPYVLARVLFGLAFWLTMGPPPPNAAKPFPARAPNTRVTPTQ